MSHIAQRHTLPICLAATLVGDVVVLLPASALAGGGDGRGGGEGGGSGRDARSVIGRRPGTPASRRS